MKIKKTILIAITLMGLGSLLLTECKKKEDVTPDAVSDLGGGGTPVDNQLIDTSWTFDKVHSNVGWESRYYDYSNAMLTGRFDTFGLAAYGKLGKFTFNGNDMSKCFLQAWVRMSSFNTGEPGRDGLGKCGPNYVGVTYLDSNKTMVNNAWDSAWFTSTSFARSGNGYVVKGNFTFNHYRPASGNADGTPVTKPVTMYLTYQGTQDFDTNSDGTMDRYRAGFTGTFSFLRSDHIDNAITVAYVLNPKASEATTNTTTAANNKTYGNWSKSIGDVMNVTVNLQAYKTH